MWKPRARPSAAGVVTAGVVGGLVVGVVVWSLQMRRYRRELFSQSPFKRLAALGYLSGHPGVETARLLSEYVSWERRPRLRRHGAVVLRRMGIYLE